MLAALGIVFMVLGGLLLLSAVRGYALYQANRRRGAALAGAWLRLVAVMVLGGGALLVAGHFLAS